MQPIAVLAAVLVISQAAPPPPRIARPAQRASADSQPKEEITRGSRGAGPLPVLNAERSWAGADVLWPLVTSKGSTDAVRTGAVRAIGRLEDPGQVRALMAVGTVPIATVAIAIAQSLQGFDPVRDPALLADVWKWLRVNAGDEAATALPQAFVVAALSSAMGRIAYANAEQVGDIELILREQVVNTAHDPIYADAYPALIRALESLARVNTRQVAFDKKTIARLGSSVRNQAANDSDEARRYAFMALAAARVLDAGVERKALADADWQLRRSAMAVLAGPGAGLDDQTRIILIREGLKDKSAHVRYEALRAYARHAAPAQGCLPLLDAVNDEDTGVAIQALDLLADNCKDSEDVTRRLIAEARVPSTVGEWHRETHAFVALAKRSPEASALGMEAFVTHPVWWVRMYAVFAAANAKDVLHVQKLAYDDNDNVREAALPHLRRLDAGMAERAILAALDRGEPQLLRTAAGLVKEMPPRPTFLKPLVGALQRLTKDRGMTSRDARLALLEAIDVHAKPDDYQSLVPWLRDYDPKVADASAVVLSHLGHSVKAEPQLAAHVPNQPFDDLNVCVSLHMSDVSTIRLRMDPAGAPIAVEQFLQMATVRKYYNGLTFHRVVPNFVIQGGSPDANEYSGARDYWRDEIAAPNARGTVGLSTRGRNTGDAQIFINLIDNSRLNGQFTVFARVDNMDEVDKIQEGAVIRSIDKIACGR